MIKIRPVPFRQMKPALRTIQAQVQLLLGAPGVEFPQVDYAQFMVMGDMSKKIKSPTHKQMLALIGAWLRFYKRLIERLPEADVLRQTTQVEFDKVSEPYKALLESIAK